MNTYTIDLVDIAQRARLVAAARSDPDLASTAQSVLSYAVAHLHHQRVDVPLQMQPHVEQLRRALI